jgi:type I restriction enzyme S subunit
MNKVESLISQFCPDGVPSYSLQEVFVIRNGYTPSKSNSKFWTDGTVPWFRMEDIQKNGRLLNSAIQCVHESALKGAGVYEAYSIIMSTSATIGEHAMIEVPFLANQRFTVLTRKKAFIELLRPKFAYYLMFGLAQFCKENTTMSSFAGVEMAKFRDFAIQIPPVKVQDEIIRILDTFTELEAELKAELKARKTQYEFYRESLFGSHVSTQKSLDSVASIWRGRRFVKDDIRSEGVPAIHYGEIYTKYGLAATEAYSFLDSELASKLRFVSPGDVVLVSAGETIEDIGKSFTWLGEGDAVIHDACYGIRSSEIDPRFMVHFFNTHNFRSQLRRYISSSKISAISTEKLGKVFIPVPSLEEQKVIADVLDSIDCLVSDLSVGLPGEITARRKQYEYFRGKLLTFKKLDVA